MSQGRVASKGFRRGVVLAASLVLIASCGGGGDDGASPTTSTSQGPPKATIPGSVAPGKAWLALDDDAVELSVARCTDTGTGSTSTTQTAQKLSELVATGRSGSDDITVTVTEFRTDSGDAKATTQTVEIAAQEGEAAVGLTARRSFFNERWVDLNEPSATTPLLERDGDQVIATGKFGPQGSRAGDPGIVDGALIARCPDGAGG